MGVLHDLALLNVTILLEEAGDLLLAQAGVNASDEEVGAGVDGTIIVLGATMMVLLGRGAVRMVRPWSIEIVTIKSCDEVTSG